MKQAMDLTEGKVLGKLLRFSFPLVLANILQAMFLLVDMFLIGRLKGADAIAVVTVGGQSIFVLLTLSLGLTAGGQILVAKYKGAKETEQELQIIKSTIRLAVITGLFAAAIGFLLAPTAQEILQTPEEIKESASSFMRYLSLSLPFAFLYNAIAGILRGRGDSRRPLYFIAGGLALYATSGYVMLHLLKWEVSALAWAAVFTQATLAGVALIAMYKSNAQQAKPTKTSTDRGSTLEILKIGLPFGLQMCLLNLSGLFMLRLISGHGGSAVATVGAVSRVSNLLIVAMFGISNGAAAMIGQSLGAKKPKRAQKTSYIALSIALCYALLALGATLLAPQLQLQLFTNDKEVIETGASLLKILAVSYLGHACYVGFNAAILGSGNTKISLLATATEAIIGRVILSWILLHYWDLSGLFIAQTIAPFLAAIIAFFYWKKGKWKEIEKQDYKKQDN